MLPPLAAKEHSCHRERREESALSLDLSEGRWTRREEVTDFSLSFGMTKDGASPPFRAMRGRSVVEMRSYRFDDLLRLGEAAVAVHRVDQLAADGHLEGSLLADDYLD